jgi:flagellar capping protein FliD
MTFNQSTFNSLSSSQIASSLALLGSSTSGVGGLQNSFNAVSNSVSGTIAAQEAADTASTTRLNARIAALQASIQVQQTTLLAQLETADAAVAKLTSQQNLLTSSIASLNFTSFGYQSQTSAAG